MLVIVIPGIWMASFLFASPITFVQKGVYVKGYGLMCSEQLPSLSASLKVQNITQLYYLYNCMPYL